MDEHQPTRETEPIEEWERVDAIDRPKWPKVIGIISIVLGSLGLICGGLLTLWGSIAPGFVESQLNGAPMPTAIRMHTVDWVIAVLSLLLTILLLFAGIAAVSYRPLTRPMHLIYGLLSLPLTVWSYLNQSAKQADLQAWAEQYPDNPVAKSMQGSSNDMAQLFGLIVMILIGFGIPVFYLIWFGLIKTKPEQITGGDEGVY